MVDAQDRPTTRHVSPIALLAGAIVVGTGALLFAVDRLVDGGGPATSVDAPGGRPAEAALPSPAGADTASPADAEAHLSAGELLAARNASGAAGASREGLLKAQAELEAALRLGTSRRDAAERILASTYAELAEAWADTDAERDEYERRARETYRAVIARSPADAGARLAFAATVRDTPARIAALRDAARAVPGDGEVRRVLGVSLIDVGEVEEGARELVEAARLLDRAALAEHGAAMLSVLHAGGREQEEARVRERLEQLGL